MLNIAIPSPPSESIDIDCSTILGRLTPHLHFILCKKNKSNDFNCGVKVEDRFCVSIEA